MNVLITGHTGFKGTWLSLMLVRLGHQVSGISLPPENLSMFNLLGIENALNKKFYFDIRNRSKVEEAIKETSPDVVIHLAAQSLVISGYQNPADTFEINVDGTLNVLLATAKQKSVKAQLIITTDKVYKNDKRLTGYRETDPLGSSDPYSTSKAMADLLTQSWIANEQAIPTAILRAGNVIGGGDFSVHRLIPDLVRSVQNKSDIVLRYPNAIRPWQHVLDCLDGYIAVLSDLLDKRNSDIWNVGPESTTSITVGQVIDFGLNALKTESNSQVIKNDEANRLIEQEVLTLNTEKIRKKLGWTNKYNNQESISKTMDWYSNYLNKENLTHFTNSQIEEYYATKQ
jgi:CDP-glucose 4,6-dehydratase